MKASPIIAYTGLHEMLAHQGQLPFSCSIIHVDANPSVFPNGATYNINSVAAALKQAWTNVQAFDPQDV